MLTICFLNIERRSQWIMVLRFMLVLQKNCLECIKIYVCFHNCPAENESIYFNDATVKSQLTLLRSRIFLLHLINRATCVYHFLERKRTLYTILRVHSLLVLYWFVLSVMCLEINSLPLGNNKDDYCKCSFFIKNSFYGFSYKGNVCLLNKKTNKLKETNFLGSVHIYISVCIVLIYKTASHCMYYLQHVCP